MPTRTHAQTLALISAINAEVDLNYKDQLSYFAKRFRDGLVARVEAAEALKNQKIFDLIYTYAQTEENGILKQVNNAPFNETLKMFVPFEIAPADLTTIETEAAIIISDTEALVIEFDPLVCPECPRMNFLSLDFVALFDGLLVPEGYTPDPTGEGEGGSEL